MSISSSKENNKNGNTLLPKVPELIGDKNQVNVANQIQPQCNVRDEIYNITNSLTLETNIILTIRIRVIAPLSHCLGN